MQRPVMVSDCAQTFTYQWKQAALAVPLTGVCVVTYQHQDFTMISHPNHPVFCITQAV